MTRVEKWILPALLVLAMGLNLAVELGRDLPTGDEINTYICNGAAFARTGYLPPVSEHPNVAVVYGVVIAVVDRLMVTLSGVLASHLVGVVSRVLAVFFVYRSVLFLAGLPAAVLAGAMLAVFPGCYFATRGDISLYLLFASMLQFCLVRLVEKPSAWRAALAGCVGGFFYLSRADGLYVTLLSVAAFSLFYRPVRRQLVPLLLCFALIPGLFLVLRHHSTGGWGRMSSDRAIQAFYQAEGQLDGLGGSWQDYTARGEKRFGPPKKYGNSMVRLALSNLPAVGARASRNLERIAQLIHEAVGSSWWVVLLIVVGSVVSAPARKGLVTLALPGVVASCIYLAFAFRHEYFVMLSFGLAIALAMGFSGWIQLARPLAEGRRSVAAAGLLALLLLGFFAKRTLDLCPESARETTTWRYWNALVYMKKQLLHEPGTLFLAADFGGARSMYLYVDAPTPNVEASMFTDLAVHDALHKCRKRKVRYVLATPYDEALWNLSPAHADVVFSNSDDDVRVLHLKDK